MSQSFLPNREIINSDQLKQEFKGIMSLQLPVTQAITHTKPKTYNSTGFAIYNELLLAIHQLADKYVVDISTVFMAAFKVLLQRYSAQEDIFVSILGTSAGHDGDLPGEGINTINGIRSQFSGDTSFSTLVQELQNQITESTYNLTIPLSYLEEHNPNGDLDSSLFQALFMFNETDVPLFGENKYQKVLEKFNSFYISLFFSQTPSSVNALVFYNQNIISEDFIGRFADHFIILLKAIVNKPEQRIGAYDILTPAEREQMVIGFNNTITPYPKEKTITDLFEERVTDLPNQVALSKGSATITYQELNTQANRLARMLIKKGVLPQDNVGLLVTRDFEMIIGMLAIMKAGGAYVPIDPDYPLERQEYIYRQSSLKIVIADGDYPLKTIIDNKSFLKINFGELNKFIDTNPDLGISGSQLAYTIYTSGSTGKPKGVMIAHHSAVNLILWVNQQFNVDKNDRLLFITSMCFDLSVYDIFGMLAAGGTLVIAEQKEIQNVQVLQKMLVDNRITFWDSVPTTMDYLVKNLELENRDYICDSLKTVFLSGDWIPVDLPERIKAFFPEADVISLGGATEGTVWSNFYPVKQTLEEWKSIPYGKPISNNFFYILNDQLQPVPLNVTGDLYIGGAGVARGYANDKEKTKAAFIPDPFNSTLGGVMYKTGDLGRMLPDMNMEFIGRKDNQVKIQGFRIELGEIESVLNGFELISKAVVLARDDHEGKKRLIGYIVPKKKFDQANLISYLRTKLPVYMVPVIWIEMDQMPLTSNGKIDRKSLPDVESVTHLTNAVEEKLTPTEVILADIWKQCMGLVTLSISDNFFELGGHSLLAVQILSKLQKQTGRVYQLAILFKYPDVKSLAYYIDHEIIDHEFKSLVAIKPSGSKPPLYIIHGEGLNVLNFSGLAANIDKDQPIFGLQAKGLNGIDEPLGSMAAIAKHYLEEILLHNPQGPYLIAGYSFGGYVAVEMQKQMAVMGKEIQMIIMFDTNAEKTEYKDWYTVLPKKVKRNFPKIFTYLKSTLITKANPFKDQVEFTATRHTIAKKDTKLFYQQLKKIKEKHLSAFRNYKITPFDDRVFLFRAKICVHYVNDPHFLGWKKYAKKGVVLFDVPGDHLSMFLSPQVQELAIVLQKALDQYS